MQYSMVAVAALVAGASAWNSNISYTTEVVDSYTTFCPYATQLTHAEKTYTVTEATLLTITNCPCTLTKPVIPVTSSAVVAVSTSAAPVVVSTSVAPVVVSSVAPVVVSSSVAPVEVTSVAPVVVTSAAPVTSASAAPPIYVNTTTPVVAPVAPSATPEAFKGAANSLAASGFSLAGVLAIAAYLL